MFSDSTRDFLQVQQHSALAPPSLADSFWLRDELSAFARSHDALDLVQAAVGAWGAILHHITAHLAGTAAAASLGRSSFHRAIVGGETGGGRLSFPGLGLGHCHGGTGTIHGVEDIRGRTKNIRARMSKMPGKEKERKG